MENTNKSMGLIYKKMNDVMKDIGFVGKDQKNAVQNFKFRGIDQFVNSLYPALCKHGVFMTPECVKEEHELKDVVRSSGKEGTDKHVSILMKYHFYAEDGSNVTVGPIPAEGLDSGDKATNKALSAALKYALIQTFSIPTEDMAEADLDSPELGKSVSSKKDRPEKAPVVTTPAATTAAPVAKSTPAAVITKTETPVAAAAPAVAKTTFKKPTATTAPVTNGKSGW